MRGGVGAWVAGAIVASAVLAAAAVPARADGPATFVIYAAPTGSLAGPPVPLLVGPPSVGTIRTTVGGGSPAAALPAVTFVTQVPQTGAYVIAAGATLPSLPGVTLYAPQVLVPPLAVPGQNPALVLSDLLQGALPAGTYIVLPVR